MAALGAVESAFLVRSLSEGLRLDGRKLGGQRPLHVHISDREGAVEVRLGETKAMAVVSAELVEPYADRPTEGQLLFFVELSPMASLAFEPGRPSEQAIELMRLLERSIRKSQAIDVETLCAVAGKRVWSVRTDVTVIDDCGNVDDAVCAAALAALMSFRLPAVSIIGAGDQATVRVLPPEQAEPIPLVFHHMPVCVTFGLFRLADRLSVGIAVDPSDREETVMVGKVAIVVNQYGEVCAMQKLGGVAAMPQQMLDCVQQAGTIAPVLLASVHAAMDLFKQRAEERAKHLAKTGRLPQRNVAVGNGETIGESSSCCSVRDGKGLAMQMEMDSPSTNDTHKAVVTQGTIAADSARPAVEASGERAESSVESDEEEQTVTLVSKFASDESAAPVDSSVRRSSKGQPAKRTIQKKRGERGRGRTGARKT